MAIGGNVIIKVNPEVLVQKSGEVSADIKKLSTCFDDLERIVNRTSYYWIGEAGDMHRKLYQEQKENVDEMMRRLEEHPRDLLDIAQKYVDVENVAGTIANELSGNVIE